MNSSGTNPVEHPEYQVIRSFIESAIGIVIPPEKNYLIEQKLEPLLKRFHCNSFTQLVSPSDPDQLPAITAAIIDAITIHESLWFRDTYPFIALRNHILPLLQKRMQTARKIRILSAGSAKGQEAYSIAMTIAESVDTEYRSQIEVIGIDICGSIIAKAQQGQYDKFEIQRGLNEHQIRRFFLAEEDTWQLKPELRSTVKFIEHNLLHSLNKVGPVDIVLIRNVMIYFADWARQKTMENILEILRPSGWLILGSMESLPSHEARFEKQRSLGASIFQRDTYW